MNWLEPITLRGSHAILEPLTEAHHDDLVEAVKDGELWKPWFQIVVEPSRMRAEIGRRLALLAAGAMLPFTVMSTKARKPVGMTAFVNLDAANRRLEIGSTWYRRSVQRTALNTECKFMLLTHAFEEKSCIAVEFRTHYFNTQSRRAIERLGAKLDGILRNHKIMPNGTLRDYCVYSIIASEWPTVRANLKWQLSSSGSQ
jgi:N-acetyltransferase